MKALLIDVGSTFIKWALYDTRSKVKTAVIQVPFPAPGRNDPPYYEVDSNEIIQAILAIIEQTDNIDSICFSVQMHGYVLGDENGMAISPYISWQDERASLQAYGTSHVDRYPHLIAPQSGSSRKSNLPVISLFAMKSLDPMVFHQANVFFTLGSYIAFRLTAENATHLTDAAASGFYDVGTCRPSALSIPGMAMPQARRNFTPVGIYVGKHIRPTVFTPVGDQQAAVLGSGLPEDCYLLNLGTAAQLCTLARQPVFGDYESRPYFDGQTLCTVTRLPGGREILRLSDNNDLPEILARAYHQAMLQLPSRNRLLVTGGAALYHNLLIDQVCRRLAVPFDILTSSDPLDGLITLLPKEKISKGDLKDA
jgi:xylulokinase